jgi:ring-1,2-phenylacetyl-CoA epoxidase subunit PaaC
VDTALSAKLLSLADDEFLLGHLDSEWTGHAPILEEDIAFANIAQDELGHAILWYNALQALTQQEPDQLTFFRAATNWRNAPLCELPKGDWAFSMLRQYLFDAAELVRLEKTVHSTYQPIAEISAKIRPEEIYHYRHTSNWVKRLGLGTEESNRRMQTALDALWPYALQLFDPMPGEDELVQSGVLPTATEQLAAWQAVVTPHLINAGLAIPKTAKPLSVARDQHTEHLAVLIQDMQSVARLEGPDVKW